MADPAVKGLISVLCDAFMSKLFAATETQESSTALAAFLLNDLGIAFITCSHAFSMSHLKTCLIPNLYPLSFSLFDTAHTFEGCLLTSNCLLYTSILDLFAFFGPLQIQL